MIEKIRQIHEKSRGTYGSPRVHAALCGEGIRIGKKRVARLMKAAGLKGSRPPKTAFDDDPRNARSASDLVERDFSAEEPDELWVADITYVPTEAGYLYLSVVLNAFSRRIVCWAMSDHLRTDLVLEALGMAGKQRSPEDTVHHFSLQGNCLRVALQGRRGSPIDGSVGDCYDNAMCKSSFTTLECELIERETYPTRSDRLQTSSRSADVLNGWALSGSYRNTLKP